jgi:hypothetical protein
VEAWVLKANPEIYDVEAAFAAGEVPFDSWRLNPSYRVELIEVGDKVFLWMTGPGRGVCAVGYVAGLPYVSQGGTRFWRNLEEKSKVRPYLPVDLVPIVKIEETELLLDPRFRNAEVIRARQMSNPSFLTTEECAALTDLLDPPILSALNDPGPAP